MAFSFHIDKKISGALGRTGKIETPHGAIETPAYVIVGTKGTVKALTPEHLKGAEVQVVLANTYHLYLEPGDEVVRDAGGLHKFMQWEGPLITDSGGFQAFSLGAAFGRGISKFISASAPEKEIIEDVYSEGGNPHPGAAKIDEDGVTFRSHKDGSEHRFTPERSMEIQHHLGADILFAFDECTSPHAGYDYLRESMERTHRWAERSLAHHKKSGNAEKQALFGIVQGGRHEDLRRESARVIRGMDFPGFGIGGSFIKEDMETTVRWVSGVLPEQKPRHLLGVGEPWDLVLGVENGIDTFDCVVPTRAGRNGMLYTSEGRIDVSSGKYARDFSKPDEKCGCYTCRNFTKAYLSHLMRAKEMLGGTLSTIHNVYFMTDFMRQIREAIREEKFGAFKEDVARVWGRA